MDEKSDQIEREIQLERGQLGSNLNELQSRVEEATDWRVQFQKKPMLMMGVALGGGLLLASMTRKRRRRGGSYSDERSATEYHPRRGTELQKNAALETFDSIKGAMIGVAANTFKDWLGEAIPGFRDQFQKTAQEKRSSSAIPKTASAVAGTD
ncbi:MAG TPA: hypothetical protein VLI55_16240 [Bryobacteraceae bacterium]|nr:hypothetical protein [Bryobacteraceae bacterium]